MITRTRAELEEIVAQMVLGFQPHLVHPSAWIAPGAVLTGHVEVGAEASVWYGAILRGDVAPITIGDRSNIQDGCIVHVDSCVPTVLGHSVVVGHGAVIHAATVHDNCLIAIRSIILSGAVIGEGSIVGAGTVVREGAVVPPRSLVLGVPGRIMRSVTENEIVAVRELAERYVAYSRRYRQESGADR